MSCSPAYRKVPNRMVTDPQVNTCSGVVARERGAPTGAMHACRGDVTGDPRLHAVLVEQPHRLIGGLGGDERDHADTDVEGLLQVGLSHAADVGDQ